MILRRDAAQATLDAFVGRRFAWGSADCVRLAAFAARQLGHPAPLAKAGRYRTEAAARQALKRAGFDTLQQALDKLFFQIPPAAALPGDILACRGVVEVDGAAPWPCLMVAMGSGLAVGFHEGECKVLRPIELVAGWRVEPCLKR